MGNWNSNRKYYPVEKPEIIRTYKDPETGYTVFVLKVQYGVYLAQNVGLIQRGSRRGSSRGNY